MRGTLGVPETMLAPLGEFVHAHGILVNVVSMDDDCTVRVVTADERRRCGLRRLYPGGFIACETARGMAVKLGIRTRQMGKLLDFLNIRVRNCGLGCFN